MNTEIFIGRKAEFRELNQFLSKKTASLTVIKGRRRVGKSRLIDEFCKGQQAYKFVGLPPDDKVTAQDQRNEFSKTLSELTGLPN